MRMETHRCYKENLRDVFKTRIDNFFAILNDDPQDEDSILITFND